MPSSLPARKLSPTLVMGLVFFTLSILYSGWIARIPEIQGRLSLSKTQLGFALLGLSLGAIAMTVISGRLLSHLSPGRATVLSLLIFCVVIVFPALAWGETSLFVALFAVGIGNGFMNVSINAAAARAEQFFEVRLIPFSHAMYSVGLVVGSLLASGLAAVAIPPEIHLSVLGVIMAVFCLWQLRPVVMLMPDFLPAPPIKWGHPPKALLWLAAMSGCFILNEGAMGDWSSVYLKTEMNASAAQAGLGYSCFAVCMALGRFAANTMRNWLGVKKLIISGILVAIVGLIIAALAKTMVPALIGFAITGLGLSALIPIIFAIASQATGVTPGAAIATVSTSGLLALLIGRPTIGALGDHYGLQAGLTLMASALVLGAVLAWRFKWPE